MSMVLRRPKNCGIMVLGISLKEFEIAKNAGRSSGEGDSVDCE